MKIFKQYQLPNVVGGIQMQFSEVQSYYGGYIQTGMMMVTMYVAIESRLGLYGLGWVNFGWFLTGIALCYLILGVLDFKYIKPSRLKFSAEQACMEDRHPMVLKQNEELKKLDEIIKRLEKLEAK